MKENYSEYKSYEQMPIVPIEEVANFLKNQKILQDKEFIEIEIQGEIKPEHIKSFLRLPYEIALTEKNKNIILTTGTSSGFENTMGDSEFNKRRQESDLSFHTHIINKEGSVCNAPSFQDVWISDFSNPKTHQLLAHKNGMMLYRPPIIDPGTGKYPEESAKYTALGFGYVRGIDIYGFIGKKKLLNMSREKQAELAREFAEKSGMIIKEAAWNKKENAKTMEELMSYINLNINKT